MARVLQPQHHNSNAPDLSLGAPSPLTRPHVAILGGLEVSDAPVWYERDEPLKRWVMVFPGLSHHAIPHRLRCPG